MKKLIDIDDRIVKDLKKQAVEAETDFKNWIQDILRYHAIDSHLNDLNWSAKCEQHLKNSFDEVFEFFKKEGIYDKPLTFMTHTDETSTFVMNLDCKKNIEVIIVNRNLLVFNEMTIDHILETIPFYFALNVHFRELDEKGNDMIKVFEYKAKKQKFITEKLGEL